MKDLSETCVSAGLSKQPRTKVEISGTKIDSGLQYLLDEVKKGITFFVEAIRKSTEEQEGVTFKAFSLKSKSEDEVKAIFDTVMSAVAIELFGQAPEMVKQYTFFHSVDKDPSTEDITHLFLHCDKTRKPPTKEEVDALVKEQNLDTEVKGEMKLAVVEEVKEEEEEKKEEMKEETKEEEVTLPHPSMMSAYGRPGCD